MDETDPVQRMQKVLDNARKIGVDSAITPKEELGKLFLGEVYNAFTNPYNVNEKECY